MKSLLLLGSNAPHVHLRLRKRPPRCTLDCGFKTSESPALRGFVGGLRALATAALYLVLKSNGLRHSKNFPVKFDFSPKTVLANIVQKLSAHSLLKSVFFRISTSLTNAPRSLSQAKVGIHTCLCSKDRTQRHTRRNKGISDGVVLLPSERSARSRTSPGRVSERRTLPLLGLGRGCSRRTQKAFGTAMRSCASLLRGVAAPLG